MRPQTTYPLLHLQEPDARVAEHVARGARAQEEAQGRAAAGQGPEGHRQGARPPPRAQPQPAALSRRTQVLRDGSRGVARYDC